jgi:hypothetical protein
MGINNEVVLSLVLMYVFFIVCNNLTSTQ